MAVIEARIPAWIEPKRRRIREKDRRLFFILQEFRILRISRHALNWCRRVRFSFRSVAVLNHTFREHSRKF
ncbi:MAG: hypothetical protein EGQ34_03980 [Sutterella sp.]|nr:hypothetical protein [Sutterella sp.]